MMNDNIMAMTTQAFTKEDEDKHYEMCVMSINLFVCLFVFMYNCPIVWLCQTSHINAQTTTHTLAQQVSALFLLTFCRTCSVTWYAGGSWRGCISMTTEVSRACKGHGHDSKSPGLRRNPCRSDAPQCPHHHTCRKDKEQNIKYL
jgi:hypothetical protein